MSEVIIQNNAADIDKIVDPVPNWYIVYGRIIMLSLLVISIIISKVIKIPQSLNISGSFQIDNNHNLDVNKTNKIEKILIENFQAVESHDPILITLDKFNKRDTFLSTSKGKIVISNSGTGEFYFDVIPDSSIQFFNFKIPNSLSNKFVLGSKIELQFELPGSKKTVPIPGTIIKKRDTQDKLLSDIQVQIQKEIIPLQYFHTAELLLSNANAKIIYQKKSVLRYLLDNLFNTY